MRQTTGVQPADGLRKPASGPRPALISRPARWVIAILAASCAAIMALIAAQVTQQTQPGWLDRAVDDPIRLARYQHDNPLSLVAGLGAPITATVIAVIVAAACLFTRRYRGAFLVAMSVPVVGVAEITLKPLIHRTISGFLSYPSGHTMGAFSLATSIVVLLTGPLHPPLTRRVRVRLAIVTVMIACFVSYSLIALRMHYFTDTIGGATLAIALVLATALVIDLIADHWTPAVRKPAETKLAETNETKEPEA